MIRVITKQDILRDFANRYSETDFYLSNRIDKNTDQTIVKLRQLGNNPSEQGIIDIVGQKGFDEVMDGTTRCDQCRIDAARVVAFEVANWCDKESMQLCESCLEISLNLIREK